jgi:2-polyprenyl-6-methoxyphenol hydroxylase-like FAD-dependent oxidoreductase
VNASETPILVVGGGPVGLALAIDLASRGVASMLVNDGPDTAKHPQGNTHNARTMEHYRRLGIAEAVRATGLPADHPTDVAYFTRLTGHELARLPMPTPAAKLADRPRNPHAELTPEPIHRASQFYVEPVLKRHAETLAPLSLRFGWRLERFDDRGPHVEAEIVEAASGRRETVRCRWLVGCDGGNSIVRRSLGIRYEGHAAGDPAFMSGRMLSFYIRSPALAALLLARRAWQSYTMSPGARSAFIALDGKGDYAGLASLPPGADAATFDLGPLLRAAIGADLAVEILSVKAWTAGLALVADRYRVGRVLLAGDAVHLFTPTGGFGMNTGIDDAANLAWKLAALEQGWGGPHLIGTYEAERRPIGKRNTACSRFFQLEVARLEIDPAIEDETPAGAAARAALGRRLGGLVEEFAASGIQLGARYDGSRLIAADGAAPPADDPFRYTPSAVPGGRAPHAWLADGAALMDRFGQGFTLLRLGPDAPEAGAFARAAQRLAMPLMVATVADPAVRALYERPLALIRPDHHVAWRGRAAPENAERLLQDLTGH